MLEITKVFVDYEEEQIGITHVPQFGWVIESDKRNTMQEAYHLQIAMDPAFENIVTSQKYTVNPFFLIDNRFIFRYNE